MGQKLKPSRFTVIILDAILMCVTLSRSENCIVNCSCTISKENRIVADCSHRSFTSVPTKLPDNLSSLDLSYNVISYPWTQVLLKCHYLIRLDISNNNITKLQPLVFSFKEIALKDLNLANNGIISIADRTFQLFAKLISLDISGNLITTLSEKSFSGLTQLQMLNLTNNRIGLCKNSYPSLIFQELKSLKILALNLNSYSSRGNKDSHNSTIDNCIPSYPDQAVSYLMNLDELFIDLLQYPEILGVGFRNLTRLQHIYLQSPYAGDGVNAVSKSLFVSINTTEPFNVTFDSRIAIYFEPGIFDNLLTLQSLQFIGTFDSIKNVSQTINDLNLKSKQFKHFEIVHIWNIIYCELGVDFMKHLHNYPIESFIMEYSKILVIDTGVNFPKTAKKISLANNKIISSSIIQELFCIPNLTVLDVSFQFKSSLKNIPKNGYSYPIVKTEWLVIKERNDFTEKLFETLVPYCTAYFKLYKINAHKIDTYKYDLLLQLEDLAQSKEDFSFMLKSNSSICYPRMLSELYMSAMIFGLPFPEIHMNDSDNQLKYLDASKNFIWCLEGPVTGFHKLEVIDLSNNNCFVLSQYMFLDFPSLRRLYLNNNLVGFSLELDIEGLTFSKLNSLEYLDISQNYIRVISDNAFLGSPKLQTLIMNRNAIQDFNVHIKHLVNLTFIDLSSNDLARLTLQTMTSLDEIYRINLNLTIDLYKNNLMCDCDNIDFIDWFISTKVNFKNKELYTCHYVNGSIIDMNKLNELKENTWRFCLGRQLFLPVIITFLLMVIVMVSSGLYSYFRVRLLFYIYVSKSRFFLNFSKPKNQQVMDVFIVYDEESPRWRAFVSMTVKPILESKGVSTYISEIDSEVGKPFRMVIEDSVLAARKTLVLLTSELFESDYHELEVNMAKLSEEMMPTKAVLFVCIEPMTNAYIPEHISLFMETSLYQYREDDPNFWDNLVHIIKS